MEFKLEFSGVEATLEGFKSGTEKIGPDEVPNAELKISVKRPSGELAAFSPTLEAWLFDKSGFKDLAEGIPVRDQHMVYPLKRDEEMTGAKVRIDYGVKDRIKLDDSKISKFRITPHDGGMVTIEFRVTCKPDAHKEVPYLHLLQKKLIALTVIAAKLPEMQREAA